MKPIVHYFLIELPGTGLALTFIGGPLRHSKRPGYVALTTPYGRPVMEVLRDHVHPSNPDDLARRIVEERRLAKAPLN
jgi:hypothetical protein